MTSQPTDYPPLSPALIVRDTRNAIAFYQRAFGARELFHLVNPEDGSIGHAELLINGSVLMLGEESEGQRLSPLSLGSSTVQICLIVDNVDQWVEQAAQAGATVLRPPEDQFYGHRCANLRDPFGHLWMIAQEIEKMSPEEMQRRWNNLSCRPPS